MTYVVYFSLQKSMDEIKEWPTRNERIILEKGMENN